MPNNYDSIAGWYDRIHHLFYGQSEINAQVEQLEWVRPGDRLLILGGGTGWILEKIAALFPAGLEITYIESSVRMMELTKRRNWGQNKLDFFTGGVDEWRGEGSGVDEWRGKGSGVDEWRGKGEFDCILTGFFFDNFTDEHSRRIVEQLTPHLKKGGYWLETDFYYPHGRGKLWQAVLLRTMYVSARLVCGVEARRLPDVERIFAAQGYRVQRTSFYYQRFIRSVAYRKS